MMIIIILIHPVIKITEMSIIIIMEKVEIIKKEKETGEGREIEIEIGTVIENIIIEVEKRKEIKKKNKRWKE